MHRAVQNIFYANEQARPMLTLPQLLNTAQPYEELYRLHDHQQLKLNRGNTVLSKIQGSLIGLAVGDAVGASVEFRPHSYLEQYPVFDMNDGGTWGLKAGQWTDDTSMALCLAASLITKGGYDAYDQLVRYKWWYRNGYMSSTGTCFDIGSSTRQAINEFESRQFVCAKRLQKSSGRIIPEDSLDKIIGENLSHMHFDTNCGAKNAAGNGPLMRLAPIPLFYYLSKGEAIDFAGKSARLTHGDKKAIDACRLYSALICNALNDMPKEKLLNPESYEYLTKDLDKEVVKIMRRSYKNERKNGYADGIRGKGFILDALEAALWAFRNDGDSFEKGVLLAVNLGDDTDTTAAIYGQLAGAYYGIEAIPQHWVNKLFHKDFILTLANGLYYSSVNRNRSKRKSTTEDIDIDNCTPNKVRY